MFQTKVVEKIKNSHFMSNNFLFQKSYNLLDNVDKYFRNRQATDDNMAHALYMLDT